MQRIIVRSIRLSSVSALDRLSSIRTSFLQGGNIEAVEICLRNGGKIDDQQDDLSTPVHLASCQGSIEILKLMFSAQSELQSKVISMADVQGMTPLHKLIFDSNDDAMCHPQRYFHF